MGVAWRKKSFVDDDIGTKSVRQTLTLAVRPAIILASSR
jgi:hypothetical protein